MGNPCDRASPPKNENDFRVKAMARKLVGVKDECLDISYR